MVIRFAFTEANLRALPLPAAGQRRTYHDTKVPGLQLRITANGTKTFSVYRRVRGGQPERVTIGRWPAVPVEGSKDRPGAREQAAQIVAKLLSAESPAEARRLVKAELTLGELFERYFADRKQAGRRSVSMLQASWERYMGELPSLPRKKHGRARVKAPAGVNWTKRRLSEITTQHISALHTRIVRSGTPTTANRVHELLRAVYGFACKQKLATENPAAGITQAKENSRSRFLGADELPAFASALALEPQPWRDYFTVLLYVGYRKSAVCAMRWQDINLDSGVWVVPGEKAKNGDPIAFPLVGPALDAIRLRAHESESPQWVFPGGSIAGHVTQPKRAWVRLCKRAGFVNLRMHDLRRTLGSWLAMSGVSLPAIGRALGHKDPRSTQVYAHLQAAAVASAVTVAHTAMRAAIADPKVIPLPIRRAG